MNAGSRPAGRISGRDGVFTFKPVQKRLYGHRIGLKTLDLRGKVPAATDLSP
jgi:hypothetical protein